jgi:exonuclease SbcD
MKILHTADWHLGIKLQNYERTLEHQDFLDWLIERLTSECIDILIIAGDIFDTGNPSNTSLEQYYRFLRSVKNTCCREVIIIGGNHDSISTLNAPKQLLKYFNVHVVGGVPEIFTDQIIEIQDDAGELELVICAVPFLRDRDIRLSVMGETGEERETRIKQGIKDHYHRFLESISQYKADNVPVIATGHLYAAGSSTSESEKDIHVGNLGQVHGDQFPVEFNYIALGHLHRPQVVNKIEHIRYSGSPIPLSFSENTDNKQVIILEFDGGQLSRLEELPVPTQRRLIRIKGNLDSVKSQILVLTDQQLKYPSWVDIQVETEGLIHDLEEQINKLKTGKDFIEHFFIRQFRLRPAVDLDQLAEQAMALTDMDPKDVFLKKCAAEFGDADYADLIATFDEVLEKMAEGRDVQ